ncbi:hypothetical protein PQX77_011395 [Marasmius sp. AFHP31]|nr:hypothetical protein PQX77_011395 [Marasmius sp. AFHP31]
MANDHLQKMAHPCFPKRISSGALQIPILRLFASLSTLLKGMTGSQTPSLKPVVSRGHRPSGELGSEDLVQELPAAALGCLGTLQVSHGHRIAITTQDVAQQGASKYSWTFRELNRRPSELLPNTTTIFLIELNFAWIMYNLATFKAKWEKQGLEKRLLFVRMQVHRTQDCVVIGSPRSSRAPS